MESHLTISCLDDFTSFPHQSVTTFCSEFVIKAIEFANLFNSQLNSFTNSLSHKLNFRLQAVHDIGFTKLRCFGVHRPGCSTNLFLYTIADWLLMSSSQDPLTIYEFLEDFFFMRSWIYETIQLFTTLFQEYANTFQWLWIHIRCGHVVRDFESEVKTRCNFSILIS